MAAYLMALETRAAVIFDRVKVSVGLLSRSKSSKTILNERISAFMAKKRAVQPASAASVSKTLEAAKVH